MKTFYGGEVIHDVTSLNLAMGPSKNAKPAINPSPAMACKASSMSASSMEQTATFEFIGAGVKLEKSNLNAKNVKSPRKKKVDSNGVNLRVNFTDVAETYEYPSYEFMLKELGIDPDTDPDYQMTSNTSEFSNSSSSMSYSSSDSSVSFSQFLPGLVDFGGESSNSNSNQNGEHNVDTNGHAFVMNNNESGDADVEDSSDYISVTTTNTTNSHVHNKNSNIFTNGSNGGGGDMGQTTNFSKLSKSDYLKIRTLTFNLRSIS